MKIWLVFENDYEGSYLNSVWSTEELAQKRMDALKSTSYGDWCIEEYEVDSGDNA